MAAAVGSSKGLSPCALLIQGTANPPSLGRERRRLDDQGCAQEGCEGQACWENQTEDSGAKAEQAGELAGWECD